jgi:hypothetical protein
VIKTEGEQELLQSIKEEERLSSLGFCCSDSQRPEKKDAVRESESCFLSCSFLLFTERERERERERESKEQGEFLQNIERKEEQRKKKVKVLGVKQRRGAFLLYTFRWLRWF